MNGSALSKEAVLKKIKGVWHHPATGNIWFFQDVFEDGEHSIFSIRQKDSTTSIEFAYRLTESNGVIFLDLNGQLHQILDFEDKTLMFETNVGEIVILYKGYPK